MLSGLTIVETSQRISSAKNSKTPGSEFPTRKPRRNGSQPAP
jgi:hypothetical protein